jgi:hypothetical protein
MSRIIATAAVKMRIGMKRNFFHGASKGSKPIIMDVSTLTKNVDTNINETSRFVLFRATLNGASEVYDKRREFSGPGIRLVPRLDRKLTHTRLI